MNPDHLKELCPRIEALEAMPADPGIVQTLTTMLQLPPDQVDMTKVVELVAYDGTITAHCLRMANSPRFGRRNTETIRGAVLALGLERVEAILMGYCPDRIVPAERSTFDALTFWRHSLGCALVSRKLAKLIGYRDCEKAYLAGLLHDLGVLVNMLVCTEEFRQCIQAAREARVALRQIEEQRLGFTHCESGKLLAEHWKFSADVLAVIEHHHDVAAAPSAHGLVSLIHLSDLLCRLRGLGYGYYEGMGIDLAADPAWATLEEECPALRRIDLMRITMDIDGAMYEIVDVVNAIFRP